MLDRFESLVGTSNRDENEPLAPSSDTKLTQEVRQQLSKLQKEATRLTRIKNDYRKESVPNERLRLIENYNLEQKTFDGQREIIADYFIKNERVVNNDPVLDQLRNDFLGEVQRNHQQSQDIVQQVQKQQQIQQARKKQKQTSFEVQHRLDMLEAEVREAKALERSAMECLKIMLIVQGMVQANQGLVNNMAGNVGSANQALIQADVQIQQILKRERKCKKICCIVVLVLLVGLVVGVFYMIKNA